MENTILKMSGITKSFSGVTVLNGVNFDLQRGEVHVLMGENGAGKSTLMKILTGVYKPNDGEIYLADESGTLKKTDIESPKAALALGISMVFQEFNLMPNMSISENISIGFEPVKNGVIDYKAMNGTAAEMLKKVGLDLAVTTEVGRLTTAEKQGVEIAKCLSHNGRIIILDEPTSSLSEREVQTLFGLIKELKRQGMSIVYISHRMEEIFEIGDRITVFRDGHSVATLPVKDVCEAELIKLMTGREIVDKATSGRDGGELEPAIEVRGVSCTSLCGIFPEERDLTAAAGEAADAAVHYVMDSVDLAVKVSAPLMIIVPSPVGRVALPEGRSFDELWECAVKNIRRAADYAQEKGVVLAVEAINRYETYFANTLEKALRLVRDVNHPAVKIMADLFHMSLEERSIPESLRMVSDKLVHVHIADNTREAAGLGSTDFKAAMRTLKDISRWRRP